MGYICIVQVPTLRSPVFRQQIMSSTIPGLTSHSDHTELPKVKHTPDLGEISTVQRSEVMLTGKAEKERLSVKAP